MLLACYVVALDLDGDEAEVSVLTTRLVLRLGFALRDAVDCFWHGLHLLLADVGPFGHPLRFKRDGNVVVRRQRANCAVFVAASRLFHRVDGKEVAELVVGLDFEGLEDLLGSELVRVLRLVAPSFLNSCNAFCQLSDHFLLQSDGF